MEEEWASRAVGGEGAKREEDEDDDILLRTLPKDIRDARTMAKADHPPPLPTQQPNHHYTAQHNTMTSSPFHVHQLPLLDCKKQ